MCSRPFQTCRRPATVLSVLFLALTGCSGEQGLTHDFSVSMEAGVATALNNGVPKYEGALFRVEKAVTLKEDTERPESLMYQPGGIRMDAEGRFYVMDGGNHRIAVFGPTGEYERSMGREGQGPGEFSGNLLALNDLIDDVLVIYNADLRRITLYRTDGTLLDMMQTPVTGQVVHYRPEQDLFIAIRITGTFEDEELWWGQRFTAANGEGVTIGTAETPLVFVKYFVPWPGMTKNDGGLEYMPFTHEPAMALNGDRGVVTTIGNVPEVYCYAFDGTLQRRIRIDFADAKVTPEYISSYQRDFDRWVGELETGEVRYRQRQRDLMVFPDSRTIWRTIQVDDRGLIWLEVLEQDFERRARGGGYFFDVLSPEGEYLGRTGLPVPGVIIRGHLLGIVTDPESDAETHTVWRLVPVPVDFSYQ